MSLSQFLKMSVCESFKKSCLTAARRRKHRQSAAVNGRIASEILENRSLLAAGVVASINMPTAGRYNQSEHHYVIDSKAAAQELLLAATAYTAPAQSISQYFFVSPTGTLDTQFNDVNSTTIKLNRDGSRADLGLIEFYANGRSITRYKDPGTGWRSFSRTISPGLGYDRMSFLTYSQGYAPLKHDLLQIFNFPDVIVQNVQAAPSIIAEGGTISGTVNFRNQGNYSTTSGAQIQVDVFLLDPATGKRIDLIDNASVNIGAMAAETGTYNYSFYSEG